MQRKVRKIVLQIPVEDLIPKVTICCRNGSFSDEGYNTDYGHDLSHAVLDFAASTEEVAQATTSPFCMLVVVNGYGLGT